MNYYEELGLSPEATLEQIRQAYRHLARLLHPDQQADETLRRLAESQMKRLNSIHKTLTDPSLRRQYDASLSREVTIPVVLAPLAPKRTSISVRDIALVAAGVAAASLYWQLWTPSPRRSPPPAAAEAVAQPPDKPARQNRDTAPTQPAYLAAELAQVRSQLEAARAERDSALARLPEPLTPAGISAASPAPPPSLETSPIHAPALATPGSVPPLAERRFGGTWVYIRPKVAESHAALYPAEYVEAVVVEDTGLLRGRYRARYRVADRPISSEVAFRFEGSADRETATLDWTGANGARGELKLRLLSRNSMQLEWVAIELGSQMGLASGSAVLTRRQDP